MEKLDKIHKLSKKILKKSSDIQINELTETDKNELLQIYNEIIEIIRGNADLSLRSIKNNFKLLSKYNIKINVDEILNIEDSKDLTIKELQEKVKEKMLHKLGGRSYKKRKSHKKRKSNKKRKSHKKKILYGGDPETGECIFCYENVGLEERHFTMCGHGPFHIECSMPWYVPIYDNFFDNNGEEPKCIVCGSKSPLTSHAKTILEIEEYEPEYLEQATAYENSIILNELHKRYPALYPTIEPVPAPTAPARRRVRAQVRAQIREPVQGLISREIIFMILKFIILCYILYDIYRSY